MSFVYGKPYKVPVWVVVRGQNSAEILKALKPNEPHVVEWPADTFHLTIKALASQGYSHEVNQPMPFAANKDFIMVAVTRHLNGPHLSGSPMRPYHSLNRTISCSADYNRLMNEILDIEPDISLCHIFDIGNLCHQDGKTHKVFVTAGDAPTNTLQRLADRVITVGEEEAEVLTAGRDAAVVADEIVEKVREFLGIKRA